MATATVYANTGYQWINSNGGGWAYNSSGVQFQVGVFSMKGTTNIYRGAWSWDGSTLNNGTYAGAIVSSGAMYNATVGGAGSMYRATASPAGAMAFGVQLAGVSSSPITGLHGIIQEWANNPGIAYGFWAMDDATAVYYCQQYTSVFLQFDYFINTAPTAPSAITSPVAAATYNNSFQATLTAGTDAEQSPIRLYMDRQFNGGAWEVNFLDLGLVNSGAAVNQAINSTAWANGSYKVRFRMWDGYAYGPYSAESGSFSISHSQTLSPGGIATGEAVGAPTLQRTISVLPGSIASAEAIGAHSVLPGPRTLLVSGIASAQAFGAPTIKHIKTLLPAGIASLEAVGTPVIVRGAVTLLPAAIASGQAFGAPTVLPGARTITPLPFMGGSDYGLGTDDFEGGIAGWMQTSAEGAIAEGLVSRRGSKSLLLTSVNGNTMASTPIAGNRMPVLPGQTVVVNGYVLARDTPKNARIGFRFFDAGGVNLATSTPPGTATSLTEWQNRTHSAVAPANAAFASAFLNVTNPDAPDQGWFFDDVTIWNVDSGVGSPTLLPYITVQPSGIITAEAVPAPVLIPAAVTISVTGIASGEAFGIPEVIPPYEVWARLGVWDDTGWFRMAPSGEITILPTKGDIILLTTGVGGLEILD